MNSLRQTFNPYDYSESLSESCDNDEESVEVAVKGHKNKVKVDVGKFDKLCKKFSFKPQLKIKSLSGQDKEDFQLMVSYVHLLYGTSYYTELYNKVKKHFKNVNKVKPGTIGAYFAGCLVTNDSMDSSEGINPACSATCAGSMPLPKDEEGWSFCDKAVILAEKGKEGYVFNVVKPADTEEDLDPAYVFIESDSIDNFSGFAKSEKENLMAMGCKKVHLVGYDSHGTNSYDFYGKAKKVHDIKHRHNYPKKKKEEKKGWFLALLLIVLMLLVLGCVYGYKHYGEYLQ